MINYLKTVRSKWKGLICAVQLRRLKEENLWMQKRPLKYVKRAEEACKVKTNLLENESTLFPNMRHKAGCSLQYIALLSHILGGTWQKIYMNPYAEYVPEGNETEMTALLKKLQGRMAKNVRN